MPTRRRDDTDRMTGFGNWARWYAANPESRPYGDSESYRLGAEFLADCETVEDWGCGRGWFARHRPHGCVGLDGSASPYAARVVELASYRSRVDGIFMRHVLEHNRAWRRILDNALASFRRKMVLVLFTPWSPDRTRELRYIDSLGVPDLALGRPEVEAALQGFDWTLSQLDSPDTLYGHENFIRIRRPDG